MKRDIRAPRVKDVKESLAPGVPGQQVVERPRTLVDAT